MIAALLIAAVAGQIPMPPPEYQGVASATVAYVDQRNIDALCAPGTLACTRYMGGMVILPSRCSPTRQSMVQRETVRVLAYTDEEWRRLPECDRLRAHEFGHVLGWVH